MDERKQRIVDGILKVMELESCQISELFDILADHTIDIAMDARDLKASKLMQRISGRLVECRMLAAEITK
jgi:hypothetical protein